MPKLDNLLREGTRKSSSVRSVKRPARSIQTGYKHQGVEMLSNRELMKNAKESLSGNWGMAVLGTALFIGLFFSLFLFVATVYAYFGLINLDLIFAFDPNAIFSYMQSWLMEFILLCVFFFLLFGGAFRVGLCSYFLGISQGEGGNIENIFTGFRRFFTTFFTHLFIWVLLFLWSIFSILLLIGTLYFIREMENSLFVLPFFFLFLLPAIAASYRYSMTCFILADDDDCGVFEAIARSKEMMKKHKVNLFYLQWSFFGWILLSILTLGVGFLWVIPYMKTSFAEFYESVKLYD